MPRERLVHNVFSQHILDFQHITCSARYLLLAAFNHTSADTKKTVEGFLLLT